MIVRLEREKKRDREDGTEKTPLDTASMRLTKNTCDRVGVVIGKYISKGKGINANEP